MKDGGRRTKSYTKEVSLAPSHSVKDDCDLNFTTILTNVQVGLNNVSVGNYLSVEVQNGGMLVTLNHLGEVCGYVQTTYDKILIDCISRGNQYRARVMHSKSTVAIEKVR